MKQDLGSQINRGPGKYIYTLGGRDVHLSPFNRSLARCLISVLFIHSLSLVSRKFPPVPQCCRLIMHLDTTAQASLYATIMN